jgi:hypothetical protein
MKTNLLRLLCVLALAAASSPARAAIEELRSAVPGSADIKSPDTKSPVRVEYYYLNRDQNNQVYDYYGDTKIKADGKAIEAKLKAAGYVVAGATLRKINGTPGNYDYNYEYLIEYTAPEGFTPESIRYYYLNRDQNNQVYDYYGDTKIKADGKAIEARLAAAGYVTVTSTLRKINGTPGNYDYNYEYVIEYLPPVGRAPSNARYYYLNRDQNNQVYDYYGDTRIKADGKAIEARLAAAGYVTVTSTLRKINGTPGNYDYNYEYVIEYIASAGSIPGDVQYYYLNRDRNNQIYDYYGDTRIKTDGKALEAKLAAAGNVVVTSTLRKVNGTPGNYDYNYEYIIEYILPLGGSSAEILTFELWKGRDGQPYWGWQGKSQVESDGKALEKNFQAAGYVILEAKLVQAYGEDRWGYSIRYVRPSR